ncbi:MAG TPA: hypothetical protein VGG74_35280 [Kofleriaceae bacterium]
MPVRPHQVGRSFTPIPACLLDGVVGGSDLQTHLSLLNGFAFNGDIHRRGDDEYRREIVKQGCTKLATPESGQLDKQKYGQCLLQNLDPPASR